MFPGRTSDRSSRGVAGKSMGSLTYTLVESNQALGDSLPNGVDLRSVTTAGDADTDLFVMLAWLPAGSKAK